MNVFKRDLIFTSSDDLRRILIPNFKPNQLLCNDSDLKITTTPSDLEKRGG